MCVLFGHCTKYSLAIQMLVVDDTLLQIPEIGYLTGSSMFVSLPTLCDFKCHVTQVGDFNVWAIDPRETQA